MTPVTVLSIITSVLGIVAATNFFYFFNIPVGIIFTIITGIALSISDTQSDPGDDREDLSKYGMLKK